jgi:hypothetical protein
MAEIVCFNLLLVAMSRLILTGILCCVGMYPKCDSRHPAGTDQVRTAYGSAVSMRL